MTQQERSHPRSEARQAVRTISIAVLLSLTSTGKAQRTMHVRTGNETFIVHCLIIHVKELRKDTAKLKIAAFLGGDDEQRAVELCVLINDVESEAVTSLHAVAQAQMLYVSLLGTTFITDDLQIAPVPTRACAF